MERPRSSIVLISLLVAANFMWGFYYFSQRKELAETRALVKSQDVNVKVVDFSRLFIDDVLRAKGEVDFETRLKLENAVRGLDDKDVLAQWSKFINAKTGDDAQAEVKNLLGLLMAKIRVSKL